MGLRQRQQPHKKAYCRHLLPDQVSNCRIILRQNLIPFLRRCIQSKVEDAVAERMLDGTLKEGDTAALTVEDSKLLVTKEDIPA